MEKKIKGYKYELQTCNYLMSKYTDYNVFLWKFVPQKYVLRLKLNYSSRKHIYNETEADVKDKIIINKFIDTGCDIMMVNKLDDNDIILVQCKNFLDKNVWFNDLAGFACLLAFSHIPLRGLIVSNTLLCEKLLFKLQYIKHIRFIQLDYIDQVINEQDFITSEIYQPEIVKNNKKKVPSYIDLIYVTNVIATDHNDIIFLCPSSIQTQQLYDFVDLLFQDYEINLIIDNDESKIDNFINNIKLKNIFLFSIDCVNIIAQIIPHLKNIILIIDGIYYSNLNYLMNFDEIIDKNLYKILNLDENLHNILNSDFDKKICMIESPIVYNKINKNEYEKMEFKIDADKFKIWLDTNLFKLSKDKFKKKIIEMNNCEITPIMMNKDIMNKDIISKINVCFWLEDLLKINRLQIADINCENIEEIKETLLNNIDKIYPIYKGVEIKSKLTKAIQHKINVIENNNFLQKFMADCYNYTIDDIIKIKSRQRRINKKLSRVYEFEIT